MLEVIEPGLVSTIQDAGRPGQGRLGVARAGAADDVALAVVNLLLGNAIDAPALEMTLLGGSFAVHEAMLVAIGGADMEAHVPEQGRSLSPGRSHRLQAGTTLVFGGALDGARTYLGIRGGVAGQAVLGSTSTDPVAGFGGSVGRPLRVGDQITGGSKPAGLGEERAWPDGYPASGVSADEGPRSVSIVPGPHLDSMPAAIRTALIDRTWSVTPRSDRVGLRLDGSVLQDGGGLELVSLPMLPGAIQLPPSGLPIVLMPDAPTVGGYPVPAVVIDVDMCTLGQLRPGDEVRFSWTEPAIGRARSERRRSQLREAAGHLS